MLDPVERIEHPPLLVIRTFQPLADLQGPRQMRLQRAHGVNIVAVELDGARRPGNGHHRQPAWWHQGAHLDRPVDALRSQPVVVEARPAQPRVVGISLDDRATFGREGEGGGPERVHFGLAGDRRIGLPIDGLDSDQHDPAQRARARVVLEQPRLSAAEQRCHRAYRPSPLAIERGGVEQVDDAQQLARLDHGRGPLRRQPSAASAKSGETLYKISYTYLMAGPAPRHPFG